MLLKIGFWVFLFIIFYSYIGYGILVWLILKIRGPYKSRSKTREGSMPEVTLVIATYNEEAIIREKIQNTLDLDYPEELLRIIIVADGSTDNTTVIVKEFPRIELFHEPGRAGKIAAINRVMKFVTTPVTVFCDANTLLNRESIRLITSHFADPEVGAVAGEKKVEDRSGSVNAAGAGEGIYWKYESFLKRLDSDFYTVVGAAGELFAVRTNLYESAGENVLLDDFIISMRIAAKGYRVIYEPGAYASEEPSLNLREEQKRKIRISAGGFQSVVMLAPLLNIFRYGKLAFQFISHRVLRWIVCPFLLPLVLIFNILICIYQPSTLYSVLLLMQAVFYLAALAGGILAYRNVKSKVFYIPYYFVFMNVSLYLGLNRFLKRKQTVLWDKATRKSTV